MDKRAPPKKGRKVFVPEDKHEFNSGDPRYHEDLFVLTSTNDSVTMLPVEREPPADGHIDFPF